MNINPHTYAILGIISYIVCGLFYEEKLGVELNPLEHGFSKDVYFKSV